MFKAIKKFFGGSKQKGFGWEAGAQWYNAPTQGTKEILLATNSSPWMFAVLFRLANEIAHLPWLATAPGSVKMSRNKLQRQLSKGITAEKFSEAINRQEMVEVDHAIIDLLNHPNPSQTKWEFFFTSVFCLAGPGEVFWLIERGQNSGQPVELWPIPPHWVKNTPSDKSAYFELHDNAGVSRKKIDADDMLWIKIPQAQNPIHGRGAGPGRALGHEIDIDENISDHILGFFVRSAIPDMIVGMKDAMEDEVIAAKEKYMRANRGSHNAHNVFFTSGDVEVKQLNPSFRDLQMVDLRKHLRDTIIQLFGMPPEQLGIIENSNRSTIDAADYLYAKRTVQPYIDIFLSTLQYRLLPQFGSNKRIAISYISPVPEDKDRILRVLEIAPDVFMIDEIRAQAGLPQLPNDEGKILYVPITYSSSLEEEEGNNEGEEDDSTPASDDANKDWSNLAQEMLNARH
jgi:HK97 family phage portal protein